MSNDDEKKTAMVTLPLNLIPSSTTGGSGGSIPHEVKQILWKNSIMTKIKEQISVSIPNSQANQAASQNL